MADMATVQVGRMDRTTHFDGLFTAFHEAGIAFARLREKGLDRSDQDLARDDDYRQLHKSGMRIARIGGTAAIEGAIESICTIERGSADRSRMALMRLWDGMGAWHH